jgi:hypothetical protein
MGWDFCEEEIGTHPVAKMTTSAVSSLPFSNTIAFFEKCEIWESFLSLISPSLMSLLAPTSVGMGWDGDVS